MLAIKRLWSLLHGDLEIAGPRINAQLPSLLSHRESPFQVDRKREQAPALLKPDLLPPVTPPAWRLVQRGRQRPCPAIPRRRLHLDGAGDRFRQLLAVARG
jgi:hypothetical protein